jgi:N-hydroxyarylamine O-acetyltransferase
MRVENYLKRIGLDASIKPDLDSLRALHRAHLMSISYENLDVQLGRPVTIDIPAVYEKIVENGRGGWCYEMNGIFGWALHELGFRVTRATGAVMREVMGDASAGNHLVLKVELDEGVYLADVGFGDGPLEPLAVTPGKFAANGFDFDVMRVDDAWWRLRNHPQGGAPSFDFNLAPADETLFATKCNWLQTAPDSIFVQNALCMRHTRSGISILRGRVLRSVTPEASSEHVIKSAGDFQSVIESVFALNLPAAASLWPKICARHDELFPEGA